MWATLSFAWRRTVFSAADDTVVTEVRTKIAERTHQLLRSDNNAEKTKEEGKTAAEECRMQEYNASPKLAIRSGCEDN